MFKLFRISYLNINSLGRDKYIIEKYIIFKVNLNDPNNVNFIYIKFYATPADILFNTREVLSISRSFISTNIFRIITKIEP